MDIEQFKIIMEAIRAAGDGAFTIAIIYFAVNILKYIIGCGMGILIIYLITKLIKYAIRTHSLSQNIADILGEDMQYTLAPVRIRSFISENAENYRKWKVQND